MALATPFTVHTSVNVLRSNDHAIGTPRLGFDELGALKKQGEDEGDFNDYCHAVRTLNERCEDDEDLAEQITVMLNRAFAYGLKQAKAA